MSIQGDGRRAQRQCELVVRGGGEEAFDLEMKIRFLIRTILLVGYKIDKTGFIFGIFFFIEKLLFEE